MPKIKEKSLEKESSSSLTSSADIVERLQKILPNEDDVFTMPVWYLDTGNYGLNYICSGNLMNGYPSRTVVELFGDASTGKTVLLMSAVAEVQRIGGIAIVNDVERRWDWEFAKIHGVNTDDVIKAYPETVEEFSHHTDKLLDEILSLEQKPKVLIVLDSVAALSTLWEMENVGTKEDQGKKAKRLKALMRVIPKKVSQAGAILLISNHIIDNPNIQYGSKTQAPGGRGVALQASIRIEMGKPTLLFEEGKERPYGTTLHMTCVKNSVCPPHGKVSIDVLWGQGVVRESGLLDIAVDLGVVEKSGGWYEYAGKKWRGKDIAEMVKTTDILQNPMWNKPYFLSS